MNALLSTVATEPIENPSSRNRRVQLKGAPLGSLAVLLMIIL
jgi:hypothetical protein